MLNTRIFCICNRPNLKTVTTNNNNNTKFIKRHNAVRSSHETTYIDKNFHQWPRHGTVGSRVEEARRTTSVSAATGASNSMHVVFDALRHLIVDDVVHASNVEATCSHWRGDKDWSFSAFEVAQCLLSLLLCTISVRTTPNASCYLIYNKHYSTTIY